MRILRCQKVISRLDVTSRDVRLRSQFVTLKHGDEVSTDRG